MDASGRFVVAQVVAFFRVTGISVHMRTLVGQRANARLFVVFFAVVVRVVVECAVPFSYRASASLVLKVPVEAGVRPVLSAFVLQEKSALFDAKALQVCVMSRFFCDLLLLLVGCRGRCDCVRG